MTSPDDQALEWLVRLNDTGADDSLQQDFARWHAQPDHAAAWARAEVFWNRLHPATTEMQRRRHLSRRTAIMGGGSALLLTPSAIWLTRPGRFADYRTGAGETRQLALPDGSRVDLAAGSALSVTFSQSTRKLTLTLGEAFFEVASDSTRPFVVTTGQAEFTALGTAFNIRLAQDRVNLTVTQHQVLARSGLIDTIVGQGQRFAIGPSGDAEPQPINPETETSWRRGSLVVERMPLAEVMDVLARNAGWTVMISDTAARIPVTAVFSLSRLSDAAETIAHTLPVRLTHLPGEIIIIRAK